MDKQPEALAQPANQSDCGHKEYRPFCQMCMATKQKPEQHHEPSWQAGFAEGKQATMNQFIRDDCDKRSRPYQEPYCWVQSKLSQGMFYKEKPRRIHTIPLYTSPPSKPWVSLTDEDIKEGAKYSWVDFQAFQSVAWWADELLKEKNT